MLYLVEARPIEAKLPELYRRLTDGTIARQKPDGPEIVESMKRARVVAPGIVRWTETCYCPAPLQHERQTQYDQFFTDFKTQVIEDVVPLEGEPFMSVLEGAARSTHD